MRATWITAMVGGAIFGITVASCEGLKGPVVNVSIAAIFFTTILLGAAGTAQISEYCAEADRRNCGPLPFLSGAEDVRRYHFPVMARCLLWAFSNLTSAFLFREFLY